MKVSYDVITIDPDGTIQCTTEHIYQLSSKSECNQLDNFDRFMGTCEGSTTTNQRYPFANHYVFLWNRFGPFNEFGTKCIKNRNGNKSISCGDKCYFIKLDQNKSPTHTSINEFMSMCYVYESIDIFKTGNKCTILNRNDLISECNLL